MILDDNLATYFNDSLSSNLEDLIDDRTQEVESFLDDDIDLDELYGLLDKKEDRALQESKINKPSKIVPTKALPIKDFYKYLEENNLDVLNPVKGYQNVNFINENILFNWLDDLFILNKRCLVFPDCDPDGLMCALEFKELAKNNNYSNYTIWTYKNRQHGIDYDFVMTAIEEKYDYVIIFDVGTNEMDVIKKLTKFGIRVIIIDHHISKYDYDAYPTGSILVNSALNNNYDADNYYRLSAGALTFCLFYKYSSLKNKYLNQLSSYALISLYSDCIDMSSELNRSIYYMATQLPQSMLPRFVKDFIGSTVFKRRFIEFTLVPKINALFRAEELDILNEYFFNDKIDTFTYSGLIEKIIRIQEESRKLVDLVTDIIPRDVLDNFVIANLTQCNIPYKVHKLYNYTGVIANSLAQEYSKPCIVLCDDGNQIKGSFRDLLGRNYLSIFTQLCNCGGHPSAFGLHIPYMDVEYFVDMIKNVVDKKFYIYGLQDNLLLKAEGVVPSASLLADIATYNEFSGGDLPVALLYMRNLMKEVSSYQRGTYKYKWGTYDVESRYKLVLGADIKIKAVHTKKVKLVSYTRGL